MTNIRIRRNNPYASSGELSLPQESSPLTTERSVPPVTAIPTLIPTLSDEQFEVQSNGSVDLNVRRPVHLSSCDVSSSDKSSSYYPCVSFDANEMASALSEATGPVDLPCAPGFFFTVYNGDISQHFSIPSETVQITRGSIKYVDHHSRYGPQTRFRFQLCHNYLQRKCTKLSECSYIHATVLPKPSEVHLNPFAPRRLAADRHGVSYFAQQDDPSVVESYETLPPGATLKIFPPNDHGIVKGPQLIPSFMIIRTVGATIAYHAGNSENSRPRHCAHYQFKRLCHLGSQCHFIHSKLPFAGQSPSISHTWCE